MILWGRRIQEGEVIPWGFGKSYWELPSLYWVVHPVPLNFVLGWLYARWISLNQGKTHRYEHLIHEAVGIALVKQHQRYKEQCKETYRIFLQETEVQVALLGKGALVDLTKTLLFGDPSAPGVLPRFKQRLRDKELV